MAPPAGAVADAPRKLHVVGNGNDIHFYRVSLHGTFVTLLLTQTTLPLMNYTIQVVNSSGTMLQSTGPSVVPLVLDRGFSNPSQNQIDVLIKVIPSAPTPGSSYTLDIDLDLRRGSRLPLRARYQRAAGREAVPSLDTAPHDHLGAGPRGDREPP
ncbi:MAG TPA: hypothetical protein VGD37_15695 [Kofleriaceae bacterium]|jgi:hypothetical protein